MVKQKEERKSFPERLSLIILWPLVQRPLFPWHSLKTCRNKFGILCFSSAAAFILSVRSKLTSSITELRGREKECEREREKHFPKRLARFPNFCIMSFVRGKIWRLGKGTVSQWGVCPAEITAGSFIDLYVLNRPCFWPVREVKEREKIYVYYIALVLSILIIG